MALLAFPHSAYSALTEEALEGMSFPRLIVSLRTLGLGPNYRTVDPDEVVLGLPEMILWSGRLAPADVELADLHAEVAAFNADPRTGWLNLIRNMLVSQRDAATTRAAEWQSRADSASQLLWTLTIIRVTR